MVPYVEEPMTPQHTPDFVANTDSFDLEAASAPVSQHQHRAYPVDACVMVEQAFSITIEILESVFVYFSAVSI
jgi:hypothetical protein